MQRASTAWMAIVSAGIILLCPACGGGGSSMLQPGLTAGNPVTAGQNGGQSADSGLFSVVMHPQPPEQLPTHLRGSSRLAPSELLNRLPPPSADKDPSCSGSGFMLSGGDYEDEPLCNLVHRTGSDGQFVQFVPLGSGVSSDTAALALYRWNLRGFNGSPTMGFTWAEDEAPADWSNFWIGFGNQTTDSWDWFAGPQDNVLTIESYSPYRAADGEVLMIVLLLGQDWSVLEKMEAGVPEQRATGDVGELPSGEPAYPLLGYGGALPAAVDFSAECAPINDQLSWYACTAFAVGDGAFNFELGRTYGPLGWDLTRDSFRVSPKYLYIISGEKYGYPPGPHGGRFTEKVISTLYQDGIATEKNAPYDGIYEKNWGAEAGLDANKLACDYWMEIPCNTWEGVETVKAVLARQRQVLPMRATLDDSFFHYTGEGVWYPTGLPETGHAMCIVGYDDSRGEAGAFKVRNSWGKYWGDDGNVWVDYRAFLNPSANIATWTLNEDYSPEVVSYFGLTPPDTPPPTGVEASDGEFTEYIEVAWDPHPLATELKVYRDEQDNLVATLAPDAVSWQDTGIEDSYGHIYWLQADQSARSAPDVGYIAALPDILGVEPQSGEEGATLKFAASGTGSGPMTYQWYFGGGADPVSSTDARPEVVLRDPGLYEGWVTCTNNLGQDTYEFELEVAGIKPQISFVAGRSGYSGDTVTLKAGMVGEATSWNWQIAQGATPTSSTEAEPQFTLGSPGVYEGSLAVSSPWGDDLRLFDLTVLDPSQTAWQLPGRDRRNSGQSPVIGPQTGNLKWKYYAGVRGAGDDANHFSNVLALADGSLIVACDGNYSGAWLRRINSDGTLVWEDAATGPDGSFGQPIQGLYTGDLYVERSGSLVSLSLADGSQEWCYDPDTPGLSLTPVLTTGNDVLYVISGGQTLLSLDATTGEEIAEPYQLGDRNNVAGPSAVAPNGTLFVASEFGSEDLLIGFDTVGKMPIGSLVVPRKITGLSLSADGWTLYTTDTRGETRAYDTSSCRELWYQPLTASGASGTGPTNAPRVMADGTVITVNRADLICALNPDTGEIIWGHALPPVADCYSTPAIGRDGTVYFGGSIRRLYALRDDVLIWQSADADTSYFNGDATLGPDGTLYCGADDGWLYAFGPGDGAALVPPYVVDVSPQVGQTGAEVMFSATLYGSEPLSYSWDFGGGAAPGVSAEANPTVTLGSRSNYSCSLTLTNPYGSHSFSFWLQVTEDPSAPGWKYYTIHDFPAANDVEADVALIDGKPAVAMLDGEAQELYYLFALVSDPLTADQWVMEPLETVSDANQRPSLAEVNGSAAVVYELQGTGLAYSARTDTGWQRHLLHVTGTDLARCSLAEINGRPATAYLKAEGAYYQLRYARAKMIDPDSSGDWTKLRIGYADNCDTDYDVTLIDNSGYPNILFGHPDGGVPRLCFARSTVIDPADTWDWTWHVVDAHDDRGQRSDMLLIGGLPAIAFSGQGTAPALYYATPLSATPDSGEDWSIHLIDQSPLLTMGRLSLVDGKPAIGYTGGNEDPYIHLAQSLVENPAAEDDWQVEQLLTQDKFQGLIPVSGQPVFILYSEANSELDYWYYDGGE